MYKSSIMEELAGLYIYTKTVSYFHSQLNKSAVYIILNAFFTEVAKFLPTLSPKTSIFVRKN